MSLSLLVVHAKNIELTKEFYGRLGMDFIAEQHGRGPLHYAAKLGSLVFEIYPSQRETETAPLRFGFQILALDRTLELLREHGVRIITEPKDSAWGRRAVVEDPDGNRVELISPLQST